MRPRQKARRACRARCLRALCSAMTLAGIVLAKRLELQQTLGTARGSAKERRSFATGRNTSPRRWTCSGQRQRGRPLRLTTNPPHCGRGTATTGWDEVAWSPAGWSKPGVTLVTVIFGGWDTHSHHLEHTRDRLLPPLNRAFGALLDDLADRGLLDTTLVAWMGEFGRTPMINGNSPPGRDHWARVYSTVLAGGGVQGGQVYGKSDNLAAEPKDVGTISRIANCRTFSGWSLASRRETRAPRSCPAKRNLSNPSLRMSST